MSMSYSTCTKGEFMSRTPLIHWESLWVVLHLYTGRVCKSYSTHTLGVFVSRTPLVHWESLWVVLHLYTGSVCESYSTCTLREFVSRTPLVHWESLWVCNIIHVMNMTKVWIFFTKGLLAPLKRIITLILYILAWMYQRWLTMNI